MGKKSFSEKKTTTLLIIQIVTIHFVHTVSSEIIRTFREHLIAKCDPSEMWLVRVFWRLCGVFTIDLRYNRFQYAYSVLLMATCVHTFFTTSQTLCKVDHWCIIFSSTVLGIYDRVLASTIFFSRIAVMYKCKKNVSRYKATIDAFEVYSPTSPAELRTFNIFSFVVVFSCLLLILPINLGRLYYVYYYETHVNVSLLVYYLFMNVQNLSMCSIETQFVTQCFKIYTKFRGINEELRKLNEENINHGNHPFCLSVSVCKSRDEKSSQLVVYDKDFYAPRFKSHPMANMVEILRIKHWLIRQSADILNRLFGIHMGLSVFYLWVVTVFDIYYQIFDKSPSEALVYGWLLQYSLRLLLIILVAHYTTKQALKSKLLITDINSRILDNSTKEELQIFLNQINCSTTEFTAYDFFTLNTQIIKSVLAASATYLVILVQLRSFSIFVRD